MYVGGFCYILFVMGIVICDFELNFLILKLNAEYGSIGSTIAKPSQVKPAVQQVPQASNTLALTGMNTFLLLVVFKRILWNNL